MTSAEVSSLPCSASDTARRDGPSVRNWVKWAAAIAVVVFYGLSIRPFWHPMSDSALYLILGDNILEGRGYTLWGHPHIYVPPGFPLFLAAMKWLGLGDPWLLNVSMMVMTLLTCWLAYKSLLKQTTEDFALVITLLVALGFVMLRYSTFLVSDALFILLVWLGIYCYLRRLPHNGRLMELGTLALIASCWVRAPGFCLAAGAAVGLVWQRRDAGRRRVWANAILLAAGTAITAAVFLAYHQAALANHDLPSYCNIEGSRFVGRSLWGWLSTPVENTLLTAEPLAQTFTGHKCSDLGPLVIVFWVPIAVGMWRAFRRQQYLCLCIVLGYVGAVLVLRPMVARYLLPVLPLLLLYFLDGMQFLVAMIVPRGPHARRIARAFAVLFLAMQIPKVYAIPRQFLAAHYPAKYQLRWEPTHGAAEFLRENAGPGDRFISSRHERLLSYFSGVPSIPLGGRRVISPYKPEDFRDWLQQGVRFAVIVRDRTRTYYQDVLTLDFLDRREDFQVVFENRKYRVYRYQPPAGADAQITAARSSAPGTCVQARKLQ